jgi:4-hydroxy-3-methylbut-2-enyl diphosphate reductase
MNRPAVREFQAPGISARRGELLVPTQVGDPARGMLRCPGAPLVWGSLSRKGWSARLVRVPRLEDPGSDAGGATIYALACSQRDGGPAALAAGASPDDRLAAGAARAAVEEWAPALGTRRLMIAASPWCGGATRALDAARSTVADQAGRGRIVHVYGELAAPPEAVEELRERGTAFGIPLADMTQGDVVIFPAHGVSPEVRADAVARGLAVVDATCPLIAYAQEQAAWLAERGDDLLLIGQSGHAAAAIAGHAPGAATVVETVAGTAALQVRDPRHVSYVLQPGIPVESSAAVATALRSRFPAIRAPHPDGFCYAPSDRAETVRGIAAGTDLMLILGDAESADARQLLGLARAAGARTHVIAAVSDLTPAMLTGVAAIGLAESTSASAALAGQLTTALAGLGPLSVVRRQVTSHITSDQADQPAQANQAGRSGVVTVGS